MIVYTTAVVPAAGTIATARVIIAPARLGPPKQKDIKNEQRQHATPQHAFAQKSLNTDAQPVITEHHQNYSRLGICADAQNARHLAALPEKVSQDLTRQLPPVIYRPEHRSTIQPAVEHTPEIVITANKNAAHITGGDYYQRCFVCQSNDSGIIKSQTPGVL